MYSVVVQLYVAANLEENLLRRQREGRAPGQPALLTSGGIGNNDCPDAVAPHLSQNIISAFTSQKRLAATKGFVQSVLCSGAVKMP